MTAEIHASAHKAFHAWMSGIEQALGQGEFLVGPQITLADICVVCEFALFARERKFAKQLKEQDLTAISDLAHYPRVKNFLDQLCSHPAFLPELDGAIPVMPTAEAG